MSNDRFLTRVFDKQEKKMLYFGDRYISNDESRNYWGIAQDIIMYQPQRSNDLEFEPISDRFIPMQCLGNTDKNKKLIYSFDIVATSNNKYLVYREEKSAAFWFKRLDNECEILINDFGCEIEIIGNKFLNPKFLEVKE